MNDFTLILMQPNRKQKLDKLCFYYDFKTNFEITKITILWTDDPSFVVENCFYLFGFNLPIILEVCYYE